MFNSKQLDRIEEKFDIVIERGTEVVDEIIFDLKSIKVMLSELLDRPVSPAKKTEKKKRKYVRSGKYAKVTTKKK